MRILPYLLTGLALSLVGFAHVDEGKAIVGVLQVERIDRGSPDRTLQKQLDDAKARLNRAVDDRERRIAADQVAQLENRIDESRPVFMWGVICAPKEEPISIGVWVDGKRSSRCKDIEVGDFIRVNSSTDRRNWNMPDGEEEKPTDKRIIAYTINDVREVEQPEYWPNTALVSRCWENTDENSAKLVTMIAKIGESTYSPSYHMGNGMWHSATLTYPIRITNGGEKAITVLRCNAVLLDSEGFPLFEKRGLVARDIAPGEFIEFEQVVAVRKPSPHSVRVDVCYAALAP